MISKNVVIIGILIIVSVGGLIFWQKTNFSTSNQQINNYQDIEKKEYRVVEGKVIVLGRQNKKEITAIDLSVKEGDFTIRFNPHATTLTKDKKDIWITATAPQEQFQTISKEAVEHIHLMVATDQIILINTETDNIAKRINIGMQLGLADLVITPDGKYAYTSAEKANAIYRIDTRTHKVHLIQLPPESKPHKLALSTDGIELYARSSVNNSIYQILTKTNEVKSQEDNEETRNLNWSTH